MRVFPQTLGCGLFRHVLSVSLRRECRRSSGCKGRQLLPHLRDHFRDRGGGARAWPSKAAFLRGFGVAVVAFFSPRFELGLGTFRKFRLLVSAEGQRVQLWSAPRPRRRAALWSVVCCYSQGSECERAVASPSRSRTVGGAVNERRFATFETSVHNWSCQLVLAAGSTTRRLQICFFLPTWIHF